MIWNDDGGGKEKMQSSGGRSFQRRGAVTDTDTILCLCLPFANNPDHPGDPATLHIFNHVNSVAS